LRSQVIHPVRTRPLRFSSKYYFPLFPPPNVCSLYESTPLVGPKFSKKRAVSETLHPSFLAPRAPHPNVSPKTQRPPLVTLRFCKSSGLCSFDTSFSPSSLVVCWTQTVVFVFLVSPPSHNFFKKFPRFFHQDPCSSLRN